MSLFRNPFRREQPTQTGGQNDRDKMNIGTYNPAPKDRVFGGFEMIVTRANSGDGISLGKTQTGEDLITMVTPNKDYSFTMGKTPLLPDVDPAVAAREAERLNRQFGPRVDFTYTQYISPEGELGPKFITHTIRGVPQGREGLDTRWGNHLRLTASVDSTLIDHDALYPFSSTTKRGK